MAALTGLSADGREDGLNGVATGYAVVTLLQIDELAEAEPAILAVAGRARETGSLIRLGFAHRWLAVLRRHQGRLDEAVAAARQTLAVCRSGGTSAAGGSSRCSRTRTSTSGSGNRPRSRGERAGRPPAGPARWRPSYRRRPWAHARR